MPEVTSGAEFRLSDLAQTVLDRHLTFEQQHIRIKKANSERLEPLHSIVKFFASFIAKDLETFVRVGGGIYRARAAEDISDVELEDAALDDAEKDAAEFEGWIYAFSFPALINEASPFPIKIGKTTGNVDDRVLQQCKGSASFDNPVILGRWQVNRVGPTELAAHNILKARGKWRENVPGVEWFNTSVDEIRSILSFVALPV